ncbi:MAG: lamin tail domain-containing protein [Saprospiraceae bacterium]
MLVNDYLKTASLRGQYFEHYPITLRAIPHYGHRFVGWEGDRKAARELFVKLTDKRTYRYHAVFEPFTHPLMDQVVINEVCPKSKKTDDWIEIYNRSEETVQLEGWVLTDLRNEFRFPFVELLPNDYLIVCRDADKFRQTHPEAYNVIGGLGFGLNKRKETLCLYAGLGASVDSVSYELPPLDTAFTISLLLPHLDNADTENWEMRVGTGTPNAANPYLLNANVRTAQSQWMQIGVATGILLLGLLLLRLRAKGVL